MQQLDQFKEDSSFEVASARSKQLQQQQVHSNAAARSEEADEDYTL